MRPLRRAAQPALSVVASVPPVSPAAAPAGEEDLPWGWPTAGAGTIVAGFDEQRNKGLDIAGKAGDPVLASADGRVVYAGAGLRGYGNLIILKHNNTYLSAYAHNQTLLVKEDQTVRKGQKIAEMGSSDADRVKLHFEIRRQGKPVDPARYLPARSPRETARTRQVAPAGANEHGCRAGTGPLGRTRVGRGDEAEESRPARFRGRGRRVRATR